MPADGRWDLTLRLKCYYTFWTFNQINKLCFCWCVTWTEFKMHGETIKIKSSHFVSHYTQTVLHHWYYFEIVMCIELPLETWHNLSCLPSAPCTTTSPYTDSSISAHLSTSVNTNQLTLPIIYGTLYAVSYLTSPLLSSVPLSFQSLSSTF